MKIKAAMNLYTIKINGNSSKVLIVPALALNVIGLQSNNVNLTPCLTSDSWLFTLFTILQQSL